jgi:hypothetical protein
MKQERWNARLAVRAIVQGTRFNPHSPLPSSPRWQSVVSHAGLACGGEGQLIYSRTQGGGRE